MLLSGAYRTFSTRDLSHAYTWTLPSNYFSRIPSNNLLFTSLTVTLEDTLAANTLALTPLQEVRSEDREERDHVSAYSALLSPYRKWSL